jgi:heme exporter protein C
MLAPLLIMAVAFTAYFVAVVIVRLRAELAARRIQTLRMAAAGGE